LLLDIDIPSDKPSISPTCITEPSFPLALNYVAANTCFLLGECEGDCDSDSNCAIDMYCFQRDFEDIPGCSGTPIHLVDYYVNTEPTAIPSAILSKAPTGILVIFQAKHQPEDLAIYQVYTMHIQSVRRQYAK